MSKTREEYLISFEEKALGAVSSVFTSLDRNLIISYSLSVSLVIFRFHKATEFNLLGAKITIEPYLIHLLLPFFISLIYLPISYQLHRIIGIYRAIINNSEELLKENADSRPISLADMRHFESGVAGLILAVARWQATTLLVNNPFARSAFIESTGIFSFIMKFLRWLYESVSWTLKVFIKLIALLALFFLPLIICALFLVQQFLSSWPIEEYFAVAVLVCVALSALATIWFGAVLFLVYFIELLNTVKGDLEQSAKELLATIANIISEKYLNLITRVSIGPFM